MLTLFQRCVHAPALVSFAVVVCLLSGCTTTPVTTQTPALAATAPAPLSSSTPIVATVAPAAQNTAAPSANPAAPTLAPTLVANPASPTVAAAQGATTTPGSLEPTAVTSPLPPLTATATPSTQAVVASPTPAAGVAQALCSSLPIRGFGLVWNTYPEAAALVGCPAGSETAVGVVYEQFEHGWMVEVTSPGQGQAGQRTVLVLFGDTSTVAQAPDTWNASKDPISGGFTPPSGLFEPQRDFGKVWREGANLRVRERLGWAVWAERGGAGAWQPYLQGQMIWTPDPKQVFVINERAPANAPSNTWRLYPDLFAG